MLNKKGLLSQKSQAFIHAQGLRLVVYLGILFLISTSFIGVGHAQKVVDLAGQNAVEQKNSLENQQKTLQSLKTLKAQVQINQGQGLLVDEVVNQYSAIMDYLRLGDYQSANQLIDNHTQLLTVELNAKQEAQRQAEAKKGILTGVIKDGDSLLSGVEVKLWLGDQVVSSIGTDAGGSYTFKVDSGSYILTAEWVNYISVRLEGVSIEAQKVTTKDIALQKVPPPPKPVAVSTPKPSAAPAPKPSASPISKNDSNAYSSYQRTSIQTAHGNFTADIMTFDLSSGKIKVVMDTANDEDCTNDCAVLPVMSFVERNGGFAGINGSYFCPASYGASCAGKTNSFYWKQYNSRVQKMINPDNTLGEQDPFLVFDSNGKATFLKHWVEHSTSGINIFAGISCTPAVVLDGKYAVDESKLDDKQRTSKISRAAISLKGQTVFVVVVQAATVQDLGYAMEALGVDNAMNIDAGGSSGMVYKKSYKLGPGRSVPNALVFVEL